MQKYSKDELHEMFDPHTFIYLSILYLRSAFNDRKLYDSVEPSVKEELIEFDRLLIEINDKVPNWGQRSPYDNFKKYGCLTRAWRAYELWKKLRIYQKLLA